jgi:hypothetical protein
MSKLMQVVPTANRSKQDPGRPREVASDTTHDKHPTEPNISEQSDTANIKQNTTNKGYFGEGERSSAPGSETSP